MEKTTGRGDSQARQPPAGQLGLFVTDEDVALCAARKAEHLDWKRDPEGSFALYDAARPEIWDEFKRRCWQVLKRGAARFSARTIFEVMRWEHIVRRGERGYAINNSAIPFYVRKLLAEEPSFEGFFELRR